jgi:hypothetical protein
LHELCVRYGYCNDLKPDAISALSGVEEIVEAVPPAEGLDPVMTDRKTHACLPGWSTTGSLIHRGAVPGRVSRAEVVAPA